MNSTYEEKWEALKNEVDKRGGDGDAFVSAMKDYYTIFEDSAIEWVAKLYDKDAGGFYYSSSARDNDSAYSEFWKGTYELKPDIESTIQALNTLVYSGVVPSHSSIPEKMKNKIIGFVHSLQDEETGFIIHPQWKGLKVDSRRGRDLMWATSLMSALGSKLPYLTPGQRAKANVQSSDKPKAEIPENLRSEEAMIDYLKSLKWDTAEDCYSSGNRIAAQVTTIESAGLLDTVIDFLNSVQNKDTGFWGDASDGYMAINAFMKISCVYDRAIPNIDKAISSIIDCSTSPVQPRTVCYQYNVWYAIRNAVSTLRKRGSTEDVALADSIVSLVLKQAPEAILATKEKALTFKKPDGSFSYYQESPCAISQGMPVTVSGLNEGDMNATLICTGGTVMNIYEALELREFFVPMFSPCTYDKFIKIVES